MFGYSWGSQGETSRIACRRAAAGDRIISVVAGANWSRSNSIHRRANRALRELTPEEFKFKVTGCTWSHYCGIAEGPRLLWKECRGDMGKLISLSCTSLWPWTFSKDDHWWPEIHIPAENIATRCKCDIFACVQFEYMLYHCSLKQKLKSDGHRVTTSQGMTIWFSKWKRRLVP